MKGKGGYPWRILLLCFLIQGGILGIVSNCRGLFYTPVCQELGIELGEFTAYATFYGLALCAAIPWATRLVQNRNLRLVLTLASGALAAAQFSMSWFTAPWQWYVAAAVQGACHAVLFVPTVPMLINHWFASRQGFFLGIACSASGLVGAVMNWVTERYMAFYGWRSAYRMLGVLLFLLLAPACAAFAVRKPEDIGAEPYGVGRLPKVETTRRQSFCAAEGKRSVFGLLCGYACLICLTLGYNQILFSAGLTFNHPSERASFFVSLAMVGTIVWKLLVGWLNDRFGAVVTCYFSGGTVIVGLGLLLLGEHPWAMAMGSFFIGMPMAISVVVLPNLVRDIFGSREFDRRYKTMSVGSNLASNFSFTLIGWLVSAASYGAAMKAGIFVSLTALVLSTVAFHIQKKGICK